MTLDRDEGQEKKLTNEKKGKGWEEELRDRRGSRRLGRWLGLGGWIVQTDSLRILC